MHLDLGYLWKEGEASLSSIVYSFLSTLVCRCSCMSLNTPVKSLHDINFMGRTRILLRLYSYNTNIYLFPMFEVTGNLPVRSVDICLLWLMVSLKTVLVRCVSGVIDGYSCLIVSCCLVDLILFLVCNMWPLTVSIDGGRCLLIRLVVKFYHV